MIMSGDELKDEEKLIRRLKGKLEEYGMPVFGDSFHIMDILQLVKDAGYSRQSGKKELVELDRVLLKQTVSETVSAIWGYYNNIDLVFEKVEDAIIAKFGTPRERPSLTKIKDTIKYQKYLGDDGLAQAIYNLITGKETK